MLFQIPDRTITTLYANFTFSGSGSWGVATWALITGRCDSTCSNCSFSDDPTACIGCNSFFIMGSDSKCSQCYTGFQLVSNNGIDTCLKCQIEFQNCNPGQTLCFYPNLQDQLNSTDCLFLATSGTSSFIKNIQAPTRLTVFNSQAVFSQWPASLQPTNAISTRSSAQPNLATQSPASSSTCNSTSSSPSPSTSSSSTSPQKSPKTFSLSYSITSSFRLHMSTLKEFQTFAVMLRSCKHLSHTLLLSSTTIPRTPMSIWPLPPMLRTGEFVT